jgi:hypothetical protein
MNQLMVETAKNQAVVCCGVPNVVRVIAVVNIIMNAEMSTNKTFSIEVP